MIFYASSQTIFGKKDVVLLILHIFLRKTIDFLFTLWYNQRKRGISSICIRYMQAIWASVSTNHREWLTTGYYPMSTFLLFQEVESEYFS